MSKSKDRSFVIIGEPSSNYIQKGNRYYMIVFHGYEKYNNSKKNDYYFKNYNFKFKTPVKYLVQYLGRSKNYNFKLIKCYNDDSEYCNESLNTLLDNKINFKSNNPNMLNTNFSLSYYKLVDNNIIEKIDNDSKRKYLYKNENKGKQMVSIEELEDNNQDSLMRLGHNIYNYYEDYNKNYRNSNNIFINTGEGVILYDADDNFVIPKTNLNNYLKELLSHVNDVKEQIKEGQTAALKPIASALGKHKIKEDESDEPIKRIKITTQSVTRRKLKSNLGKRRNTMSNKMNELKSDLGKHVRSYNESEELSKKRTKPNQEPFIFENTKFEMGKDFGRKNVTKRVL